MARRKGSLGLGVDESEIKKLLLELDKRKGTANQQLSMYDDLPKRTFVRKEKPPFGLTIFKVIISVTSKKLPNVYKSCPKRVPLEK